MYPDRIFVCSECNKPFGFKSGGGGPIQDREDYWCPHCGAKAGTEKTGGVPDTFVLTPEQLAHWQAEQKK